MITFDGLFVQHPDVAVDASQILTVDVGNGDGNGVGVVGFLVGNLVGNGTVGLLVGDSVGDGVGFLLGCDTTHVIR